MLLPLSPAKLNDLVLGTMGGMVVHPTLHVKDLHVNDTLNFY